MCALGDFLVLSAPVLRQIARYLPHHRSENASKTHPKSSHDKFKTASKFFKQAGISALAVVMGGNVLPAQGEELFYNHPNVSNNMNKRMKHKCKITILKRECYKDLQAEYLADPKSGPCPYFREGQEIIVDNDNFFRMLHGTFCAEAWDCISRYVYAALQGGSIMQGWTNNEKVMITCCNDGMRPVIFKLERIDEEV